MRGFDLPFAPGRAIIGIRFPHRRIRTDPSRVPVASCTPEGTPSRCPLCGAEAAIEFSDPAEDAPCPNCGCLLWQSATLLDHFRNRFAEILGVDPDRITAETPFFDLGSDSLDMVELVMEIDEQFDFEFSDEQAAKLRTIGDLVRLLQKQR